MLSQPNNHTTPARDPANGSSASTVGPATNGSTSAIDPATDGTAKMLDLVSKASAEAATNLAEHFAPYVADPYNPLFANYTDEVIHEGAVYVNATLLDFAFLKSDEQLWLSICNVVESEVHHAAARIRDEIASHKGAVRGRLPCVLRFNYIFW
jgi:hypothetical protein